MWNLSSLPNNGGKSYPNIIGTFGSDDPSDTLEHEICHALYYTNDDYRAEIEECLALVDLTNMNKMLLDWGYGENVLMDECHAYLSADYDWTYEKHKADTDKFEVKVPKEVHLDLRKIRAKYLKDIK